MSNLSLYDYSRQLLNLFEQYNQAKESEDKALLDDLEIKISDLLIGEATKVDRCVGFMRHCDQQLDALEAEIEALKAYKEKLKAAQKRMTDLASFVMETRKVDELEGNFSKFRKKESVAVLVKDLEAVPQDYLRIKTSVEVDKAEAGKALKSGVEIPGLMLEQRTSIIYK